LPINGFSTKTLIPIDSLLPFQECIKVQKKNVKQQEHQQQAPGNTPEAICSVA
jgi:hypothetical protein